MILKLAGSICVLAACTGFAGELIRRGNWHRKYLEAYLELTQLLSAEIRYERIPIQEALIQIQRKVRPEIGSILLRIVKRMKEGTGRSFAEIWECEFRESEKQFFLTGEEVEEVCRIGKNLGFLDPQQQEVHLRGCEERLRYFLSLRQKELEEKRPLYRWLGVAAGIFMILILV